MSSSPAASLQGNHERKEPSVSESLKSVGAVTLFGDDPKRSKELYARVFEAPTVRT